MTMRLATDCTSRSARLLPDAPWEPEVLSVILRDRARNQFLGSEGWTNKFQAVVAEPAEGGDEFVLQPDISSTLYERAAVQIEVPARGLVLPFDWPPSPPEPEPIAPPPPPTPAPHRKSLAERIREPWVGITVLVIGSFALGTALGLTGREMRALQARASAETSAEQYLATLRSSHQNDLQAERKKAEIIIKSLKSDYEADVITAKIVADAALSSVKSQADKQIASLTDQIRTQKDQISGLDRKLSEALTRRTTPDDLREEAGKLLERQKTLDKMESDLKSNKDDIESQKAGIVRREAWFADREKSLSKKEQEVAALRTSLEVDKKANAQREVALNAFYEVLTKEKEELVSRKSALDERERNLGKNDTATTYRRAVWGAAAVSPDGAFYIVANQVNEDAATRLALASCSYGASTGQLKRDCRLVTKFSNACISVARPVGSDLSKWQWATRSSKEKADSEAVRNCDSRHGNCTVRVFLCSPDDLWPYD